MRKDVLMSSKVFSEFEAYIHRHYLDILKISPVESVTPFEVENTLTDKSEFLFIAKCSPYLYDPVKSRDIKTPTNVKFTMYVENTNLIIRFDLLGMILESEIKAHQAPNFLSILLFQEFITLVITDSDTNRLIWFTNSIPFRTIRFHYKEIFELYGVIKKTK